MKREITIGEALTILVVLLTTLIGWGVSVEVRLATMRSQQESTTKALSEMIREFKATAAQVNDIHMEVVRHDERINAGLPQVITRGDGEFYSAKPKN